MQLAKADADDDIRKLKSLLKESEEVIHEERCRVLKLSKIIEEVSPRFLGVVKDSAVATLTTTLRHINLTSNFHQSSLNLTRLTKSSKSSTSRDSSTISSRKSTISKGTFIPETGPIPKEGSVGAQLLSWVNSMSKSMSGITILIDSGHNILLDDYLPPYQELRSLETLKNGQQVARVVFKLISQCLAKSASLVPPIQSTSTRSTSRRLDDNSEKKVITLEKLNLLKEVHQSNPPQLYSILMEYLQGYFPNFTPLQLDRILSGTIDSIEILLSELIFLWCGMDGHTLFIDERNEIQKLTEKQHHHLQEVEKFVSELQKTKLFNLGLTTSATTSSITEEDENKNTEEGERIENISFDMTPYLHDDIYQPISRAIDDYFTLKLPEELFKLFTEFHNEIQLTNEFINTVYLKEKLASNGLQYLIDTQRNFALNCIHHIAEIERSSNTRTSSYEDQNLNEEIY